MFRYGHVALCGLVLVTLGHLALALEPFEITVHDDAVAEAGKINLELQLNNYLKARTEQEYEGEVVPNGTTHLNFEPSFGLGSNLEMAAHFLMGLDGQGTTHLAGGAVRLKYAFPKQERAVLFYALNGEIGYLTQKFREKGWAMEFKPAICMEGSRLHWHINPTLGWELSDGNGVPDLGFATTLGIRISSGFTLATELYSEFGPINAITPLGEQEHVSFLVGKLEAGDVDLSLGVGRGITAASPTWITKFQIGTTL